MSNLLANNAVIIHAIGWTILHSLWQGLMLFCILKIALRFITEEKAKLRYNISITVLSAHTFWIINTFIDQLQQANKYITTQTSVTKSIQETITVASNNVQNVGNNILSSTLFWIDKNIATIVTIYIIGITALTIRLIYNLFALNKIKDNSKRNNNELWGSILTKQAKRLAITRDIDLLLNKRITTPMVMGVFKPVIIFPFAAVNNLSTDQFEAILIHELAHIKRHDYMVNIIQTVLETIFFYNPFVWLISKTIRIEREHSCDDIVTNNTNKLPYAHALAILSAQAQNSSLLSLAATGNKYLLLNRIKRIIEMKKSPITKIQITAVIVLVLSLVLSITLISPTLSAQTRNDKKEQKNIKKDDKKKKIVKSTISLTNEEITIVDDDGTERSYTKIEDIPQKDREKLQKAFGNNTTVYYGPQKKVIIKNNSSYDVHTLGADDIDIEIDELGENVSKTVVMALNNINWDEIGEGIGEAMKGVGEAMNGTGKALDEVGATLDGIDWDKLKVELNSALEEMSPEEKEKIKKELAKAKIEVKLALANAKGDIGKTKKEIIIQKTIANKNHEEAMEKHHKAMAKHKEAMSKHKVLVTKQGSYDKMLSMMDKDGLINRDKKFIIEKKGKKELYIDGIKQSNEVYSKYKKYLSADELLIKGSKNSLTITVKDN